MVGVTLEALNFDDVEATGTYVAFRVGDTQKLARVAPSRHFDFPQNIVGNRNLGKVDLLKKVGSTNVSIKQSLSDAMQEITIPSGGEGSFMKFRVVLATGDEPRPAIEKPALRQVHPRVMKVKSYLADHDLERRMSEAMQAVLREMPSNPTFFLCQQLIDSDMSTSQLMDLRALILSAQKSMSASQGPPQTAQCEAAENDLSKLEIPIRVDLAAAPATQSVPQTALATRYSSPSPVSPTASAVEMKLGAPPEESSSSVIEADACRMTVEQADDRLPAEAAATAEAEQLLVEEAEFDRVQVESAKTEVDGQAGEAVSKAEQQQWQTQTATAAMAMAATAATAAMAASATESAAMAEQDMTQTHDQAPEVVASREAESTESLEVQNSGLAANAGDQESKLPEQCIVAEAQADLRRKSRDALYDATASGAMESILEEFAKRQAEEYEELRVIFSPGKLGVEVCVNTGRVRNVREGSQAEQKGVRSNMWIHEIQGEQYSGDLMKAKMTGNENYEVVFLFPNAGELTTCLFSPGELGLIGKLAIGSVTGIHEGSQAEKQDVQQGMVMMMIDGQPYSKQLLDAKVAGTVDYEIAFARELGQTISGADGIPDDTI